MEPWYRMKKIRKKTMRSMVKTIALIFMGVVLPLLVFAQEKLTFKEAVKIGLEKNLTLNQEKNNMITSTTAKTSSFLQMTPGVNIQGNAGRNDGNSFNQQEGEVVNGKLDFISASINASVPLFNGLNNINTYKQVNNQNEAQIQLVRRTNQDVIRNVANQFLLCLLDQQLLNIQQKNVETQQQQYDQIKEQVAAGSRAEVDMYNQEYQLKNAELLRLRASNTLKNDKIILAQTIQLDPVVPFELAEPDWDVNNSDQEMATLEELYAIALEKRGDLARARFTEKSSELGFRAAKGVYFPNVSLFAQYGSQYNYIHPTPEFTPDNRPFENQFLEDNVQLTYGLSFNIPLFTGLQTRSTVVRNKMAYENARLQAENTEIIVKSDVLRTYQNYQDAKTNYEATLSQLKAAEISYSLEKERYALGISDIVALTLATQNYTRAESDFASSKYTLMFQRILIDYASGTLQFEDIP
jgi:outer membrane protein